ncbi:MAG: VWA domain-containing protein [Vicinamibacteria bacterium]|nr:VWA domain-containing protein [Vicinamibacteria bacterium]
MSPLLPVLLLWAPVLQAAQPQAQPPIFATQVESVFIDVFLLGESGRKRRLTADDFILEDEGAPQAFDLVPTDTLPIHAVLVFDVSGSVQGPKLDGLRAAALSFLKRLRSGDEAGLISFSDEITWLAPLTGRLDEVRQALASLRPGGATSVRDALFSALIMPRSALRTLVVLFSDGEDSMSWLGRAQIEAEVRKSNALIHVVAARSEDFKPAARTPSSSLVDSADIRDLRALAELTGGSLIAVTSPNRIEAAFHQIIDEMRDRYVLRYDPTDEPRPGWHRLDVRLKSGKGKMRGRAGYWVEAAPH